MMKLLKIDFDYLEKNVQMLFHQLVDFEVDIQSLQDKNFVSEKLKTTRKFYSQNIMTKKL